MSDSEDEYEYQQMLKSLEESSERTRRLSPYPSKRDDSDDS